MKSKRAVGACLNYLGSGGPGDQWGQWFSEKHGSVHSEEVRCRNPQYLCPFMAQSVGSDWVANVTPRVGVVSTEWGGGIVLGCLPHTSL